MTDIERKDLEAEQDILMKIYEEVESEPEKYKDFQKILDFLDDRAEYIRGILEGGWQDG